MSITSDKAGRATLNKSRQHYLLDLRSEKFTNFRRVTFEEVQSIGVISDEVTPSLEEPMQHVGNWKRQR